MSQLCKWSVIGAVAVALTSVAFAQDKPADTLAPAVKPAEIQKSAWQKMDANNDGKVTAVERQALLKERFKEMDANGDAKLTADEFGANRLAIIDVNKDGVVTLEEYLVFFVGKDAATGEVVACDKLDANGDNLLTPVEVIAYRKSVFKAADANGDGKITKDEMKAYTDKQFKDRDANKDGFVTVEEMVAVVALPAAAPKADAKAPEAKPVEVKVEQPAK